MGGGKRISSEFNSIYFLEKSLEWEYIRPNSVHYYTFLAPIWNLWHGTIMAVIYDYKLDVFIAFQKHTHEKNYQS